MIMSLDIGASFAKAILADKNLGIVEKCIIQVEEPKVTSTRIIDFFTERFGSNLRDIIEAVAVSGGGSRFIGKEIFGLPVKRVDEIVSIGLGGILLARKNKGLIVSAGTGTAVVAVYNCGEVIKHVGGTGIGGGTLLGLSRRMLGLSDFKTLEEKARRGCSSKVDLTVGDIVGGSIGMLSADATASNFGKLARESRDEDVAAGIFNIVSQTIGVVAAFAAKAYNLEDDIVIVGMLAKSWLVSRIISETVKIFNVKAFIPENCEFAPALGAAAMVLREIESSAT
jgi:type II pantothenate kinase